MSENTIEKTERNIFIRIFSSIFWFILTVILSMLIAASVVGFMAGAELNTAGMSASEAYNAGAKVGGEKTTEFMANHGGKVLLSGIGIWLALSITGIFPGVSKYKKK